MNDPKEELKRLADDLERASQFLWSAGVDLTHGLKILEQQHLGGQMIGLQGVVRTLSDFNESIAMIAAAAREKVNEFERLEGGL